MREVLFDYKLRIVKETHMNVSLYIRARYLHMCLVDMITNRATEFVVQNEDAIYPM